MNNCDLTLTKALSLLPLNTARLSSKTYQINSVNRAVLFYPSIIESYQQKAMVEFFGFFTDKFDLQQGSLELIFSPSSDVLKKRWRNNRLSAYFVADYCSSFLPLDEDNKEDKKRIKNAKGAVSYVANELLENAMRYNNKNTKDKVKFGIYFLESEQPEQELTMVILTKNSIDQKGVKHLQSYMEELLNSDPDELYVAKVEQSLEDENSETSGLGLLTMINDYSAKLGWKFETIKEEPNIIAVTTMAQIQI